MQLLIIGKTGQVASELSRASWPNDFRITQLGRSECDLRSPSSLQNAIETASPHVVINAAAYTAVDKAESEPELAEAINADAPGSLARLCAGSGAALIHLSTDYVFDGEKPEPYQETDPVNPLSVYGRSKARGEAKIRAALDRHVILRTSWVFSNRGRNFVKAILRLAREKPELKVVDDQIGGPTAAADIAQAIAVMVKRLRDGQAGWGTFHYASDEAVSWCGFARAILEESTRSGGREIPLQAISTAEYPTPARRPANSVLDCGLIRQTFGIEQPSWRRALSKVIAELQTEGKAALRADSGGRQTVG